MEGWVETWGRALGIGRVHVLSLCVITKHQGSVGGVLNDDWACLLPGTGYRSPDLGYQ